MPLLISYDDSIRERKLSLLQMLEPEGGVGGDCLPKAVLQGLKFATDADRKAYTPAMLRNQVAMEMVRYVQQMEIDFDLPPHF